MRKRISRILVIALAIVMLCPMFTCLAAAVSGTTSGSCGNGVNWSYSSGTLNITGNGYMNDFPAYDWPTSSRCMPWYYLKGSIKTVNIGSGVKSVGACAFWGCSSMTSLTLPSTLEYIGFAAFADCKGLTSVNIPSGIIGESAFIRNSALTTVTIGNGVTSIGVSAFEECNAMNRVNISSMDSWCRIRFGGMLSNPTGKAHKLYLNNNLVTSVTIPSGITEISDYAFEYLTDLQSVTIPSSVKSIGEYSFYMCSGLTSVTLNEGLKSIGGSAFDSCSSLRSISFPNSLTYIGGHAFKWVPLSSVNIYQGKIEDYAFSGCGAIYSVTLGSGITSIGDNAFYNCAGLNNVTYAGSQEQWNALPIGSGNEKLTGARLTCNGTGSAMLQPMRRGFYIGKEFEFGSYEQDNNTGNGAEPISWTVLQRSGDYALVVSTDVLDFRTYEQTIENNVTWEDSDLRDWLNNEFYNSAFTASQKALIDSRSISTPANSVYGTTGGNNTTDKIFLLSANEVRTLFADEYSRTAACSELAVNRNGDSALRNPNTGTSYWWLRTPGVNGYTVMYVDYNGVLQDYGMASANVIGGVRPAMWVNVSTLPSGDSPIPKDPNAYWFSQGSDWYYATNNMLATGWMNISGKYYYFNDSGKMLTNWQQIDGKWYYFGKTGVMTANNWLNDGGTWYYFNKNGELATGWTVIGGKYYYFKDSGVMVTGWKEIGGKWYYFSNSGTMVSGWKEMDSKWYYFSSSGAMVTGWKEIDGKWYYFKNSGVMASDWVKIGSDWYYFSGSGVMKSGWQKISDKWYYFAGSGKMVTGWKAIDGKWYYFKDSGIMATGWTKIGSDWYYFTTSGVMKSGWQEIGGVWYFFENSGRMATGWHTLGSTRYYFGNNGEMATGWQVIDDNTYYFNNSGAMKSGWQLIDGVGYYFADGVMITGWLEINDKWFFFEENGAWNRDAVREEPTPTPTPVTAEDLKQSCEAEVMEYIFEAGEYDLVGDYLVIDETDDLCSIYVRIDFADGTLYRDYVVKAEVEDGQIVVRWYYSAIEQGEEPNYADYTEGGNLLEELIIE